MDMSGCNYDDEHGSGGSGGGFLFLIVLAIAGFFWLLCP